MGAFFSGVMFGMASLAKLAGPDGETPGRSVVTAVVVPTNSSERNGCNGN